MQRAMREITQLAEVAVPRRLFEPVSLPMPASMDPANAYQKGE